MPPTKDTTCTMAASMHESRLKQIADRLGTRWDRTGKSVHDLALQPVFSGPLHLVSPWCRMPHLLGVSAQIEEMPTSMRRKLNYSAASMLTRRRPRRRVHARVTDPYTHTTLLFFWNSLCSMFMRSRQHQATAVHQQPEYVAHIAPAVTLSANLSAQPPRPRYPA
jgi:hypothetical protein